MVANLRIEKEEETYEDMWVGRITVTHLRIFRDKKEIYALKYIPEHEHKLIEEITRLVDTLNLH